MQTVYHRTSTQTAAALPVRLQSLVVIKSIILGYLEHVLHVVVHLSEGWSVGRLPVPALSHESVDPGRTARRTLHSVSTLQELNQIILRIFKYQTDGQIL